MSDSDDDSLPNNAFTFQNHNTTISVRGPNVNNTNITALSFRNNVLTSTMHMPVNFERQRYGGSNCDQRSMYYRREMSPMSLRSVPNYGPSTFTRSKYQNGLGDQRSMYNGRGASPVSTRSIDSTASVSAADIVFAFKNVKFNKYDLRAIKDAYNKLIKTRQRKRIEKRRNLKLFFKRTKNKSGEDSGEQGSDSSISSDDCRSVSTTICKEKIPGLREIRDVSHFNTKMHGAMNCSKNVSHFGNNMKDIPMYTDCTENIKQNTLRNMMTIDSNVSHFSTKERFLKTTSSQHQKQSTMKVQNTSAMTQKERFKKGFLLPSQRFNKTLADQVNNDKKTMKPGKNRVYPTKPLVPGNDCDQEEIFNGFSVNQKNIQNVQRKRSLDTEDFCYSNKKRNQLDYPIKPQSSESKCNDVSNGQSNDFIFAKPKIPIKKVITIKEPVPEKLLAKSRVPPIEEEIDLNFPQCNKKPNEKEKLMEIEDNIQSDMMHSNSDMSMRPSFIKRKLFTQKLDVAEHKNTSSDSLGTLSPQNIYSASMKEKNKARKLVTSQSCLSREILGEDNNVLDLIHKIVPPDQINSTNVTSKTESCNNRCNDINDNNKWDVTSVIANCDNQDISDTYTDEEIFNVNCDKNSKEPKISIHNSKKMPSKLLPSTSKNVKKYGNNKEEQIKLADKERSKKSVTECVKSFWDTDFESDMEFNVAPHWKSNFQQNKEAVVQKRNGLVEKQNRSMKKAPIPKGILTVRNCHKSILNNSLKSHRIPISSDKDLDLNNPNSVLQGKDNTKVGKNNKESNTTPQTGKKKDTVKENVPVNSKIEEDGRKRKSKQCVDCIQDKPMNSSKKANKNTKLTKHNDNSDDKKLVAKNSSNNICLPVNTKLKYKDGKNSYNKQASKDAMNKINKPPQKNNATVKESLNVERIQPKRKSKENSFLQTSALRTKTKKVKAPNKMQKNKSSKELVPNNISIDSINTIMTRSREKMLLNYSQVDYSSNNLSNISNRSLRLRQRVQLNIN